MTEYLTRVRQAGCRLTKARRAVIAYLQAHDEPQTAATVHRGLRGMRTDLASVYRTLELLERLGVVSRESDGKTAAYAFADHHHHHIVCRGCHRKTCLPCALRLPSPRGFSAVQHQVVLTGVCASCAQSS